MAEDLQKHLNEENRRDIERLFDHAEVANREMGVIKNDIGWIKRKLEKVDNRNWWILGTVLVGIGLQVIINLM